MRKFLKSRRGAALEMAIMMSVVTFALSTLVLTTALLQHGRKVRAERSMTQGIVLDQMGEDFCDAMVRGTSHAWKTAYEEDYNIFAEGKTLLVTDKDSGELLLRIELTPNGTEYTVKEWTKK
ncbi:MAG: hypothetical protein IKB80_06400 [Oscillospiraceae bacterium]|nr:hypothetical protein [Oscillospiraceae bacterium]